MVAAWEASDPCVALGSAHWTPWFNWVAAVPGVAHPGVAGQPAGEGEPVKALTTIPVSSEVAVALS